MIKWCPVIPLWFGNAPVPIVAWSCAVLVGDEPTVASWYHVPFSIRESRYGWASGHSSSTFMPPASQTIVTTSFGVASVSSIASFMGWPSIALNPSKCSSFATVGAMPASVTGRLTLCPAGTNPGPYQSMGTSST